ncbi:MAG: hypothetical protein HY670_03295, partial [Chloroflexi bacterium]|nr:hypothetical protein [Chloroflexota bacterium]
VGPFDERLNIIFAPNATGKSSLFEALRRALLDVHRVSGRDVEAVRPWGRSLTPEVAVDFEHGGATYRVTKRFLEEATARLERWEDGRFVPLAEGTHADEQVRAVLTSNPPGKGLARRENWGLAQVLWAPQGDLALALSRDVVADIRACLGTQALGPDAGPLEKKIDDLYSLYFTAGGQVKRGKDAPHPVKLEQELQDATQRERAAMEEQQAFEEAAREVQDLRARRAQAGYSVEELEKALKRAREQAQDYRALESQRRQLAERLKAAEARYRELKRYTDDITAAKAELKQSQETLVKLEADAPLHAGEVRDREKEAAESRAALDVVRSKGRVRVDEAREKADLALRFAADEKDREEVSALIEKISNVKGTLEARKLDLAELVAPDAGALRGIRKALAERNAAQLRVNAALITLEVVPEKDGSLLVIEGETRGEIELRAGAPAQAKGSPEVVADLPGVARLRASGPPGSIQEHRRDLAAAEQKLKGLADPYGTEDLEQLEELAAKREASERKAAEARTQLETLLSGRSEEDLRQKRSRLEKSRAGMVERHPEWGQVPPDAEGLKGVTDQVERSFKSEVGPAEDRWEAAQQAWADARARQGDLVAKVEHTKGGIARHESKLARLTSDGLSEQQREEEKHRVLLEWEAAKAAQVEIAGRLAAFGPDPEATAARLDKQLAAARAEAERAVEQEKFQEGKLQLLSNRGTYSALAALTERVERLKAELEAERLHVEAVRLLHDTVARCRAEAIAAVAGPVEAAATRTVQRICGLRPGRVKLDDSFVPEGIIPTAEGPVPLESASGGEREQVYLATRLALADVLARKERQLVVLDDVLLSTDAPRLARILDILEEAAEHLQIVVLTCHPERYRALERANFIDLEAICRPR